MKELKEFLTFYGVTFDDKAKKAELDELSDKVQAVPNYETIGAVALLAALGLTEAPEEVPVVDITEDGEQASLEFCNLVGNGMSFDEARAFMADKVVQRKAEAEEQAKPRLNLLGLPAGAPDSANGLIDWFAVRDNPQHPDTSEERLIALFKEVNSID